MVLYRRANKKHTGDKMKVGDLVRYRGWGTSPASCPLAVVVEVRVSPHDSIHDRIRVTWAGEKLPIQAKVLSVKGDRTTTWVHPKHFEVVGDI